tara:strand:- start:55 stop:402 length:348 start_codon:yes stop_codon:yes gene_type:complete
MSYMKNKHPPYPDPKRLRELSKLIDRYRENIFLVCLTEGITKKDIISYCTRLCAIRHLDELLNNPCPMRLISEIEDLAEYKRLCPHQQKRVDKIKYGSTDAEWPKHWGYWSYDGA